jgi:predicted AlkP superfamily phosphohydrolase/phosphomutase
MKYEFARFSKRRFFYIFLGTLLGALILGIIVGLKGAVSSYISIFSLDTLVFLFYNLVFYLFSFFGIGIILFFAIGLIENIISKKFPESIFLSISVGFFIALDAFILFNPWFHMNLLVRYKFLVRLGLFLDIFIIISFLSIWFLIGLAVNKIFKDCSLNKTCLPIILVTIFACIGIYLFILALSSQGEVEINDIDFQTVDISSSSISKKNKIIFIGVDGATFDIIKPLIKKGKLPHFKQIMENGCWGELSTSSPTWTPIIWTSIATGKIPVKHGIYSFAKSYLRGMNHPINFQMIPQFVGTNKMFILLDMIRLLHTTPYSSGDRKVPALWNIFSKAGLKVGIIQYPVTWPAEEVNGFLISDRFNYSSLDRIYYPSELQNLINSTQAKYQSKNYDLLEKYPGIRDYFISDKITEELAIKLLNNIDVDLFIVYFNGTDKVGHFYWKYYQPNSMAYKPSDRDIALYKDLIPDYYQYIDKAIGRIIDQKGNHTIIIASDHGMEAQPKLFTGSYMTIPSGNHMLRQPGILLIRGPSIKRGVELKQINILDLAPTILALAGLPVARDMDGRIISKAFDSKYLSAMELKFIESYGRRLVKSSDLKKKSKADKDLIKKLKSLGYIH